MKEAIFLEDVMNPENQKEYMVNRKNKCVHFKMLWWLKLKPSLFFLLFITTALFSCAVLYAEIANFFKIEFRFLDKIITLRKGYFTTNLLMFLPLSYILVTTYIGLFSFRITQWYELYPRHSDPASLVWAATILARLLYPMCYNYLEISQIQKAEFLTVLSSLSEGTIFGAGIN